MGNNLLRWPMPRIHNSKHISTLSTIGSSSTGDHCISPLMSLNTLAPVFLPHFQSSSDPRIPLGNSNTISFPLAQLICGIPPQITQFHAPSNNQHTTDGTFLLLSLQLTNQSKPNAAAHQPNPESSTPLTSRLQHQKNCLQSIHKTIQQFNQHLKAEHLDRQEIQLISLQLQNDFALLRCLLFSDKDTATKDSATSPLINPNTNPTSNPTLSAFTLPCTDDANLRRSTSVGAVGPARAKTNNSANAYLQPTLNTQEAPPTTVQNLASRIYKLEKLFTDEIATYTSITAGIHSQYFFFYDKVRQLEPGNSDVIIWKIPSLKSIFESAKVARPSSDPLIERATSFSSPIFRTHSHGYKFFINFYPYGIGPATGKCASILFTLFPGEYDNLLKWPFSKLIHIGIRDQLDPLNTWMKTIRPEQDLAYKKPRMSTKNGAAIVLIITFIPHSKFFSETEGFLIDGASFVEIKYSDPTVLQPQTQTSLLFPFP